MQPPMYSLFPPVHNLQVPSSRLSMHNFGSTFAPPPPQRPPPLPFYPLFSPFTVRDYDIRFSLLCHTVAFIRIILESYCATYHQVRPWFRSGNTAIRLVPRIHIYSQPTLIEYILGGPGTQPNLIPLSIFQVLGIRFPDISTPPPLMSDQYHFTLVPGWRRYHLLEGRRESPQQEEFLCGCHEFSGKDTSEATDEVLNEAPDQSGPGAGGLAVNRVKRSIDEEAKDVEIGGSFKKMKK